MLAVVQAVGRFDTLPAGGDSGSDQAKWPHMHLAWHDSESGNLSIPLIEDLICKAEIVMPLCIEPRPLQVFHSLRQRIPEAIETECPTDRWGSLLSLTSQTPGHLCST